MSSLLMTRHIYILLILVLSFSIAPTWTHACGSMSEKACCQKENRQSEEKNCCDKAQEEDRNANDSCEGKCKNPSCHCPSIHFSLIIPSIPEIGYNNLLIETENLSDTKTYASSGFHSIWTPPKIS